MTLRIRDFKKHTFDLCTKYLLNSSVKNTDRMVINLRRWAHTLDDNGKSMMDYGYHIKDNDSLKYDISYCSDRMNSGRAKSILRLMDELSLLNIRKLFRK